MKKYFIVFILLVSLCGCSEVVDNNQNNKENLRFNSDNHSNKTTGNTLGESKSISNSILEPPVFKLRQKYRGILELRVDDIIEYKNNLTLIVDDKQYIEDILELGEGEHVLEAYVWDENSNQSDKILFNITIYDEQNVDFINVYSKTDLNSEIIDIINKDNIEIEDEHMYIYEFVDQELISWKYVKLPNQEHGYIVDKFNYVVRNIYYNNKIVLLLDNGKELFFNDKSNSCRYAVDDSLAPYGYFIVDVRYEGNKEESIIIDYKTGKQIQTQSKFTFSPNHERVLTCNPWRSYEKAVNRVQILKISDKQINIEWTNEFNDFGTGDINWLDENNVQTIRYIPTKNDWDLVNSKYKKVVQILSYENGQWKLSELNNNKNHLETITIYECMSHKSKIIKSINKEEIDDKVSFVNTYEIIDNELVLWFEMKFENDKRGYMYRPIKDFENPFYSYESSKFNLILENGECIVIDNHVNNEFDLIVQDDLAELGYYTLYITYGGEGYSGWFINAKTGKNFYTAGSPILSTSKNKFAVANFDLEAGFDWNGIQIFSIDEKEIFLEFEKAPSEWGPSYVGWVDDTYITFTKIYLDPYDLSVTEVKAEIIFNDGSWIIREIQE